MRSAACSSRPYCACRKEGISNKVLAKMSVEELRSLGLNMGNAKLVKDAIDALAPPHRLRCTRAAATLEALLVQLLPRAAAL